MKKHKFKINESTTPADIIEELEYLKNANVKTIPLNQIRRIIFFLGGEEVKATGASVRFYHRVLEDEPFYYQGYFQVHKIHKGGNKEEIRKGDFVKYLYPPIIRIIEILDANE